MIFSSFINLLSNRWQNSNKLSSRLAIAIIQVGCCSIWVKAIEPAAAAETVTVSYGAFEFSVSVNALETYADTGKIEGALKNYTDFLTPEQLEQFQTGLNASSDFDHLAIAQFLYSFQGEKILQRVSQVVETKARQSGFYALRSALILAAADPERGLTPLNVLKKFPTDTLRIDSVKGFKIIKDLSQVVRQNSQASAAIEHEAEIEIQDAIAAPTKRNLNLLLSGNYRYRKQQLMMKDLGRDRTFPVDLYLPQAENEGLLPLIVISHGLGSDLTTFAYFAKHLASHGFAVAVPEHPGSSANQIQALLSGLDSNVTPPEELIDRPLDIQFLLDRLAESHGDKIDTNNVGAIGQSFGAYTTLALAGAEINWQALATNCPDLESSWNLSLLIQCLTLQVPTTYAETELQDERIKAAISINPLVSSVFGEESLSKIEIPIMLVSGSADPITPALPEQIIPFTWLTTPKKYLVLLVGGTHFSTLNESAGSIPVPSQAIGPAPKIAQNYLKQLGLAFFGNYISDRPSYGNYLNAAYAEVISQQKFPLKLVEFLPPNFLQLASPRK